MARTILLLLACAALASPLAADPKLEIHEWGVFAIPRSDHWAMRDMRREWSTLPKFMFGRLPTSRPPVDLTDLGCVYKPVIFLHADASKLAAVKLEVRFWKGRPLVWWPATNTSQLLQLGRGKVVSDPQALEFALRLYDPTTRDKNQPFNPPSVPAGHWIEALRRVRSNKLYTLGNAISTSCWGRSPRKRLCDNFVYYDGMLKIPSAASVTRDGETIELTSRSTHDWLDVMLIERRDGRLRVADWTPRIASGERRTRIRMRPGTTSDVRRLREQLLARLTGAGLNEDEAQSLVTTWDEGLFGADGLMLFYRVPQKTYDRLLPLTTTPKAARSVRVGLIVHPHLEPELGPRVRALIRQLGARRYQRRVSAHRQLARIGGPAFEWIERHAADPDAEVAARCRELLQIADALPLIKGK